MTTEENNSTRTAPLDKLKGWLKAKQQALTAANVIQIVATYEWFDENVTYEGPRVVGGGISHYAVPDEVKDWMQALFDDEDVVDRSEFNADGDGGGGQILLDVNAGSILHTSYHNEVVIVEHEDEEL